MSGPIRVLLADDSATVRRLVQRLLEKHADLRVVGSAENGRRAVELARRLAGTRDSVEVILLDVEMPVMDGIQALAELTRIRPTPRIVMLSAHTRKGAAVTLRALARGASDYVCKPSSMGDSGFAAFEKTLVETVRACGQALRGQTEPPASPPRSRPSSLLRPSASRSEASGLPPGRTTGSGRPQSMDPTPGFASPMKARSRPRRPKTIRAVAIGSSTGGPQAVLRVLREAGRPLPCPLFITQHMPPAFTAAFAEQIGQETSLPCSEARNGEKIERGHVYVAPGDYHMLVARSGMTEVIRLSQSPPENFCRPAVDPMLRSLVEVYGGNLLVIILTGMGSDGLRGCQLVAEAGGRIIAQDKSSSVVWGMPGAVAGAGLADAVLPLSQIGLELRGMLSGAFA